MVVTLQVTHAHDKNITKPIEYTGLVSVILQEYDHSQLDE